MTPTTLAVGTDQTVEAVEYNHKNNEYRLQTNLRMICYWQSLQAFYLISPMIVVLLISGELKLNNKSKKDWLFCLSFNLFLLSLSTLLFFCLNHPVVPACLSPVPASNQRARFRGSSFPDVRLAIAPRISARRRSARPFCS